MSGRAPRRRGDASGEGRSQQSGLSWRPAASHPWRALNTLPFRPEPPPCPRVGVGWGQPPMLGGCEPLAADTHHSLERAPTASMADIPELGSVRVREVRLSGVLRGGHKEHEGARNCSQKAACSFPRDWPFPALYSVVTVNSQKARLRYAPVPRGWWGSHGQNPGLG